MSTTKLALTFRIFQNDQLVRETTLDQAVIKIGKVPSAHLRIDDDSVSRMHAVIEVNPHEVCVIDLGSTRGTFINGSKINKARLVSGDVIQVGDVRLELVIGGAAGPRATVAPPPLPPPPPPAALRTAPAVAPPPPAIADEPDAAGAVEVAAMLGDSVIHVKHCIDPRSGALRPATWAYLAAGAVCLLVSAAAFLTSVRTSADNDARREHWLRVEHKPAYAFRPRLLGPGVDWLAFGGLALGLVSVTLGLARARRERVHPYYRIGTAAGVEAAVEHAPAAAFPLVAPAGDAFVFNFAAGIDGELIVDGKATPLADLATTGRARPSASTAGAIEVAIPPRARIRARVGGATFVVSSVGRPRRFASPILAHLERRVLGFTAGSIAVHALALGLLQLAAPESAMAAVSLSDDENTRTHLVGIDHVEAAPERVVEPGAAGGGGHDEPSPAMAGARGTAGDPNVERTAGHQRIAMRDDRPAMTRAEAVEAARTAGIFGSTRLSDGVRVLSATGDYENGFDAASVTGALTGPEGASWGTFGAAPIGDGGGGGCLGGPCGTIASPGGYGHIGDLGPKGDGWSPFRGHGGLRPHTASVPTVGTPELRGESTYDKSIVRRYVRRHLAEIGYCYEKQLLAHPTLGGEIKLAFMISPTGNVVSASGAGFDATVASCLADVIQTIEFPPPSVAVQVNYPFQFHAPGSN